MNSKNFGMEFGLTQGRLFPSLFGLPGVQNLKPPLKCVCGKVGTAKFAACLLVLGMA
jgi:hypothetical protein